MMINKRLIQTVPDSKKYITGNIAFQWIGLVANITITSSFALLIHKLLLNKHDIQSFMITAGITLLGIVIRFVCIMQANRMGYFSTRSVKKTLRHLIYAKLTRLGISYSKQASTSEIVQVSVEGVEQLETYFGAYLPQFFYSILAPLTLFIALSFISIKSAVVLLICVPLIPITIAIIQTFAKKLLSKYWGQYTGLGNSFLENLQGLTTLKIYQADAMKHNEMNKQAENFRRITMKVLTMQLNSITVMDFIAFGGSALGIILAVSEYQAGNTGFAGCLIIILLSAEFFLPMRQLGSFFHIAMNGIAACDKIFHLLDLPESDLKSKLIDSKECSIQCFDMNFSYEKDSDREVLHEINMLFPQGSFTSIVGESGCGKSTIASLLLGNCKNYTGSIRIGSLELSEIAENSLMKNITLVSHKCHLWKGTVRKNLLMGNACATDEMLWSVLEQVNLKSFLISESGLDTLLLEGASNFSGGQCQRLALARALLHDSPVYIFDEATSNIDVESKTDIMLQIHALAKSKTVILISHHLKNIINSDNIYVLDHGTILQSGTHTDLLEQGGLYQKLWKQQELLEGSELTYETN